MSQKFQCRKCLEEKYAAEMLWDGKNSCPRSVCKECQRKTHKDSFMKKLRTNSYDPNPGFHKNLGKKSYSSGF